MNINEVSRRKVLSWAAGVGVGLPTAGLLAACGDDSNGGGNGDGALIKRTYQTAFGYNVGNGPEMVAREAGYFADLGIDCEVIDVRSLVPLDTQTILGSVARTHRLFSVEENPRLCGWGAEIMSIVADEAFYELDGPLVRITTPHCPLPAADILEDAILPTVDRIVDRVRKTLNA